MCDSISYQLLAVAIPLTPSTPYDEGIHRPYKGPNDDERFRAGDLLG